MDIKISDYYMKKINKFAADRLADSSGLYKSRGESRVDKIVEDIVVGTMGEFAVYKVIKALGLKCSKPDLTIYEKSKKSFKADLFSDNFNIHVKSQSTASAEKYDYSWLCQRSDSLYKKPGETDIFAFCCVDLDSQTVTFLGFCYASDVKLYELWRECKIPYFRRTKVALYLSEFADYDILNFEL